MLEQKLCADGSQMHIGMVGSVYGGIKVPINRPRLIEPFLECHIESNRLRPERRCSSARYQPEKPALAFWKL